MAKHEHQYSLITLAQYAQQAESFGLSSELNNRLDWYVCSHGQNRDSDSVSRSNFRTAVRLYEKEGVEHQIVRFGHWLCGWVEHILVHPAGRAFAESIVCDDYPILDDMDHSEVECDDMSESWEAYGRSDFLSALREAHPDADRALDALSATLGDDYLWSLYEISGAQWEHDGNNVDFRLDTAVDSLSRDTIAKTVRFRRADNRANQVNYTIYDGFHMRGAASAFVLSPLSYQRYFDLRDLRAKGVRSFRTMKAALKTIRKMEGK